MPVEAPVMRAAGISTELYHEQRYVIVLPCIAEEIEGGENRTQDIGGGSFAGVFHG